MDISLCMPDYTMIHTFTSVFFTLSFWKSENETVSLANSSEGRGKSKVEYNDSQTISGLYLQHFRIIFEKQFLKEKSARRELIWD